MRASIIRAVAAAIAVILLAPTVSCGKKEMPGRLDGMYSFGGDTITSSGGEMSQPNDSSEVSGEKAEYASPKFKSGTYTMVSSSVREQYAYSGKDIASAVSIKQTYTYRIKLTVNKDGSMKAVYTFKRIQTSYEGSFSETIDTNDGSGKTSENAAYYDLIGKTFTVDVSKDFKLKISGVDKITQKYPDTAYIIDDENLLEISSDLFYNIPVRLSEGSLWKLNQSGLKNTYCLKSAGKDNFVFDISGEQLSIPEPFTTEDGAVYTYTSCEPLKGSLVIDRSNRMLQEQSSYQQNSGVITFNGKSYTFTDSANSLCSITQSK